MSFTTRFGFGRPSRLVIPSMSAVFDGSTRIFLSIERLLHVAHAPERSEVDWPNVSLYARGSSPTILSGSGIPISQIQSVHIDFSRKPAAHGRNGVHRDLRARAGIVVLDRLGFVPFDAELVERVAPHH